MPPSTLLTYTTINNNPQKYQKHNTKSLHPNVQRSQRLPKQRQQSENVTLPRHRRRNSSTTPTTRGKAIHLTQQDRPSANKPHNKEIQQKHQPGTNTFPTNHTKATTRTTSNLRPPLLQQSILQASDPHTKATQASTRNRLPLYDARAREGAGTKGVGHRFRGDNQRVPCHLPPRDLRTLRRHVLDQASHHPTSPPQAIHECYLATTTTTTILIVNLLIARCHAHETSAPTPSLRRVLTAAPTRALHRTTTRGCSSVLCGRRLWGRFDCRACPTFPLHPTIHPSKGRHANLRQAKAATNQNPRDSRHHKRHLLQQAKAHRNQDPTSRKSSQPKSQAHHNQDTPYSKTLQP